MKSASLYLFDLPIYRLSESNYVAEQNAYIDKVMTASPLPSTPAHPSTARRLSGPDAALRDHLWHCYGGAWQFNEVVGYLRVHLLGTQVRAEHWSVPRKRVVRTRRKTLEYVSHKLVSETELPVHGTNAEILSSVLAHVERCRVAVAPRVLDTTLLENLGPLLNWRKLVAGA